MPLRLAPLALLAVLLVACGDTGPTQSPNPPARPPASGEAEEGAGEDTATPRDEDATPSEDGIVGTWELVAQEGYGDPQEVPEQRLTFYDDGRMVMTTVIDGQRSEQEMQYRIDGDQLVQAVGVGAAVAQASRWSIEGDRLTIEQPETGTRDVYRRVR